MAKEMAGHLPSDGKAKKIKAVQITSALLYSGVSLKELMFRSF